MPVESHTNLRLRLGGLIEAGTEQIILDFLDNHKFLRAATIETAKHRGLTPQRPSLGIA